uniref:Ig-like domain-containing protein n=1 Tax=Salmo trutta TaxID=8032 RepID=A0A674E200_SALTR
MKNRFILGIYTLIETLFFKSLTPVILVSPPPSMVVHRGDNVTLQCTNVLKDPGHVAWFKQVNVSEPLCIASMYISQPYVKHHNGFQPSHMEMFINNKIIFLKITEVDVADSGLYCCGMYNQYFIFTNMTFLMVPGNLFNYFSAVTTECYDDDGTMYLLPLVVILAVVTAVLLIVIIILFVSNSGTENYNCSLFHDVCNLQNQDPDALNYAALKFTSEKRKMERRREKELDPHVVYAATR